MGLFAFTKDLVCHFLRIEVGPGPGVGDQCFCVFFVLSAQNFPFLLPQGSLLVEFGWCIKLRGAVQCTFLWTNLCELSKQQVPHTCKMEFVTLRHHHDLLFFLIFCFPTSTDASSWQVTCIQIRVQVRHAPSAPTKLLNSKGDVANARATASATLARLACA